jgi:hypothetical protein
VAAVLVGLLGCTNFPEVESGECGNAVLEKGEDCDTFVNGIKGAVCGAPGTPQACHFTCEQKPDGKRGVCPPGRGCAPDGTCREYDGGLEAPKLISSDLSSWLSAADFDADGRMDVLSSEPEDQLQQARFRLHYFDSDTRLEETRTFPRVTTRPLARRLNGDAADDLVFSNLRIGLLPGRRDRSFLPATFSSYSIGAEELRAVSVSDSVVGEDSGLGIVLISTTGEKTGVFVPFRDAEQLALRESLERPIRDLVAAPFAAHLVTTVDSPCAEVVLGFRGERSVQVLDMCELAASPRDVEIQWRAEVRRQDVSLPRGRTLQGPPLAADVDGDGHLDLLLNDGEDTYVAYGDGEQLSSEASRLTLTTDNREDPYPYPLPKLLAAGDVTGDGIADFVLPIGVLGSRKSQVDGSTVYSDTFANTALPWTTAFVGDLNANGHADVVAATEGADGISFINGSSGPFALGSRLTTRGPVRALTTGDFDGDLIRDISFVEGSSTGGSDLLAMIYGARDELPLEAVRVAEVQGLQQLGRQRALGVDDVFITSNQAGVPDRTRFTLFAGDTSRLPFAPYTLVTFATDGLLVDQAAPALILGHFVSPDQDDVLSLGFKNQNDAWGLWLLPRFAAGNDPPRLLSSDEMPAAIITLDHSSGPRLSIAGVAADLDGDGLDEALWLLPSPDGTCELLTYSIDARHLVASAQSKLRLDGLCVDPQLLAADPNTDGRPDLLLLVGGEGASPRRLQILWNDGGGGFSLEDSSVVAAPGDADVRAFAVFFDNESKLAFVTAQMAFTATTREDSRRWQVTEVPGRGFNDARSVVVTDPNGDGLADMLVADADGLWLAKAELR